MTQHGFTVLNPLVDYPSAPIKHLRLWDCGVTWRDVNPERDVWDYGRLDAIVDTAHAHGTAALTYVLGMSPMWAAGNPSNPYAASWIGKASNSLPTDTAAWDAYVWNTATRYKGRIRFYQVWNEPQLREFMYPYTQVDRLGFLTRRAWTIINKVDPDARIVSAGVLPRPSSGGMKKAGAYLASLRKYGWPVDIHAAHVYPEIGAGPDRWRALAQSWKDGLRVQKAPLKPLWVTETNYNLTGGPLGTKGMVNRYVALTSKFANDLSISRLVWYAYGVHSDPALLGIRFTESSLGTQLVTEYE
jgi:hypothetical protein